LIFQLIIKFN